MHDDKVKIAAIQMEPKIMAKRANLDKILFEVRLAANDAVPWYRSAANGRGSSPRLWRHKSSRPSMSNPYTSNKASS